MLVRAITCPTCGAPVEPLVEAAFTTCAFCGASVKVDPRAVEARSFVRIRDELLRAPDPRPRLTVAGRAYALLGRLGAGRTYDVFLAETVLTPTERVVVRLARRRDDADRRARALRVLRGLASSTVRGADYFTLRLPEVVSIGTLRGEHEGTDALVTRYRAGFVHTLADVRRVYPEGIDGRHGVWIWRRLLETLGFLHGNGVRHGSVHEDHALVHAREHGVMLVGYGESAYVSELGGGARSTVEDLAGSARVVAKVLGGDDDGGSLPTSVPEALARLLGEVARGERSDAMQLHAEVAGVAEQAYGPPKFHAFTMPAL